MPTEKEVRVKYKILHDELSSSYYTDAIGLTKEEFDLQHGKIWNDMEAELIAEGYIKPSEPIRDLAKEIDALKAKIVVLEKK